MNAQRHPDDDITDSILEFLSTATGGRQLTVDQDYVSEGLVDSLLALELVTQVEVRFGVEVEVEDLDLDNFRTASRIAAFVRRKRGVPEHADG
ncbi:acyl carrier protein [Streptomyces sp. NPDC054796]